MPVVQPGETTHSKPAPMYQPFRRVCASSWNAVAPNPGATGTRFSKSKPAFAYPPVMYGIQWPAAQPARKPMVTISFRVDVQKLPAPVSGEPRAGTPTGGFVAGVPGVSPLLQRL